MQPCISQEFLPRILDVVLPQVDVLLQAIVVWVVLRIRSTYAAEQRMLSSLVTSAQRSSASSEPRESPRPVRVRKRSSTRATTSTSPGDTKEGGS